MLEQAQQQWSTTPLLSRFGGNRREILSCGRRFVSRSVAARSCVAVVLSTFFSTVFLRGSNVLPRAMAATCRLELMGLHDTEAYRRHARGVLQRASKNRVLSGLNIPNKKPGEPLLEWAATLAGEIPECEVTVHYSLKHQRQNGGNPADVFVRWCKDALDVGVRRVLLVTGPRGPSRDAVWVLERLSRKHPAPGRLRLGVAFNACLPTEAERQAERLRLVQKLRTGLVDDVWLNTGVDEELLDGGIVFIREQMAELDLPKLEMFASAMLPSEAQLAQMRERPWNGVQFSDEFLSSTVGMGRATGKALAVFKQHGVEPIVESKVRHFDDLNKLDALLKDKMPVLERLLGAGSSPRGSKQGNQKVKDASAEAWASHDAAETRVARGGGSETASVAAGYPSQESSRGRWVRKEQSMEADEEVAVPVETQPTRFPTSGRRWANRGRGRQN